MSESQSGRAVADDLKRAAARGDVIEVIERLYGMSIFDGLVRQIRDAWSMDGDAADFCVSEAVDTLWQALQNGDRVDEPCAFLYKVAWRNAWHTRRRAETQGGAEHRYVEAMEFETAPMVRQRRRAMRIQAIRIARELLGRVGQINAQRVMTLVLEAVEQDRSDLTVEEISEILGLTPEAARKNLERGMERLARAARDAGMLPTDVAIMAVDTLIFDEEE